MPIDPSIALGVRPVEQPNVLGQMAQAMAMRQAQQEYENEGGLRNALTGGLPEDPSSLLKYGKSGRAVYESALKGRKEQLDSDEKRNTMLGGFAGFLMENPTPANFESTLTRAVNYKLIPEAKKLELLNQYGSNPEAIKKYATEIFQGSINAQAQQANATSRANNAATVGASYYSTNTAAGTAANTLNFQKEKYKQEQDQLTAALRIVSPERASSATATPINMGGTTTATAPLVAGNAPMSGGQLGSGTFNIPMGGAPSGVVGKPNTLATQVAPQTQTDVNAFNRGTQKEQLVSQISQLANLPTIAGSRLLENKVKEYNVLYPTEKIEQDRQGNFVTIVNGVAKPVVGLTGLPVQGKPLPETAFERSVGTKTGEDIVAFVKRVEAAPKNIAKIDEALGILKSGGAVTGFGAENRLNLQRAMSLFGDDVKSGKRVVDTQILDALLGSDVFPSLQAMGLGSKNIDTPNEREYIRNVITGTIAMDNDALIRLTQIRRNVETDAIKEYNQKLESGKFDKYSKAAGQKLEKIEVLNPIIRKGKHKNGRSVIEYADGTVEYGN
jgi:hypothetical protein